MRRILVVDDEEIIVNSLASYLEDTFEIEVYRAYSAVDAMALMKKTKFSIVITDISMPAVSGLELLDYIKKCWPACRVIILTAYSNFQYAYSTLKYDNVDYILKIEEYDVIRQTVQKDLDLLEQEERAELFCDKLDSRISELSFYFRGRTINKLFEHSGSVEQDELKLLEIPLRLDKPLLLVTGRFEGSASSDRLELLLSTLNFTEKNLSFRKIHTVFHDMGGIFVWILQTEDADQLPEEVWTYIYEVFNELPEIVYRRMGEKLKLVMGPHFISASELHDVYQRSLSEMEAAYGESCMRMLREDCVKVRKEEMAFPGAVELEYMVQLLKMGNDGELFRLINEKMDFLRSVEDLRQLLPLPAVSAMEMLLMEAGRLYGTKKSSSGLTGRLYGSERKIPGAVWLDEGLHDLKRILDEGAKLKSDSITNLIKWVNTYISGHYTEELTLTGIARLVNYNPSYLSRIYKEQTGMTIIAYINLQRVEMAKKLLLNSGLKIKDIAAQSGFYSVKHFNQVFKKYTGRSAGSYRDKK